MLKISSETTDKILEDFFNESLETGTSPDSLKLADITPIFKISPSWCFPYCVKII